MKGQVTEDTVVEVAANDVWEVYGSLEFVRLVNQLLSNVIGTAEVVEGDGSAGTILRVTFPPGSAVRIGCNYLKERVTKIDDGKRIRVTEIIEGGFRDVGFDAYKVRSEIIDKDGKSSIIRSTIEYEINDDKLADVASQLTTKPIELMAETIGKHLSQIKKN